MNRGLPRSIATKSVTTAAVLGGGIGSLYASAVGVMQMEPHSSIGVFLMAFAGIYLLSTPLLVLISAFMGPPIAARMVSYKKHRTLAFTFAGGIAGLVVFVIGVLCCHFFVRPIAWSRIEDGALLFILSTVAFCYGAATGTFTSLDLGTRLPPDDPGTPTDPS